MILKKNIVNLLLGLMIILSFISYEYTLYRNYYQSILLLILLLGSLTFLFGINNRGILTFYFKNIKNNFTIYLLSFFMLFTTLVSSFKLGLVTTNSIIFVLATIISLYIFYLYIPLIIVNNVENLIKKLSILITIFSIIGIIIYFKGFFLGYTKFYNRSASIFFDPNYFGTLCAVGFILSFFNKGIYKLFAIINLVALICSGSRGATFSLLIVLIIFYFYKRKINLKSIFLLIISSFIIFFFIKFLTDSGFFRTYQGLSSRDFLWEISFGLIKEEPLWGYGYGAVSDQLSSRGAKNVSSHNAYLDFILKYGIPAFALYILVIIKAIYLGVKNSVNRIVLMCAFLLLINANTISINLGGLGATSLLVTLFLGISNASRINDLKNLSK